MAELPRVLCERSVLTAFKRFRPEFNGSEVVPLTASNKRRLAPGDVVVCWSSSKSAASLKSLARDRNARFASIGYGWLLGVETATGPWKRYSLMVNQVADGIESAGVTAVERLLNGSPAALHPLNIYSGAPDLTDPELLKQARNCIDAIVGSKLSVENGLPEVELPASSAQRVLVAVDEQGPGSFASPEFQKVLAAALEENPNAECWLLPPQANCSRTAVFENVIQNERVFVWRQNTNPIHLLEQVNKVYVTNAHLGFEALMVGVPVVCFGNPAYSGWGLTDDRGPVGPRKYRRTVEEVFAAAYLCNSIYRDPDTNAQCAIERVIEHLALQRSHFKANAGTWLVYGFPQHKHWYVRHYLRCPWGSVQFINRLAAIPRDLPSHDTKLLLWGKKNSEDVETIATESGYQLCRMEDGFLRSVQLGSNGNVPASQAIDRSGIYFDSTTSNDLEKLLASALAKPHEISRAQALREQILKARISKYNVGKLGVPLTTGAAPKQRVVLVPGQVETDASIRFGAVDVSTNAELLRLVREKRPDAYIIYKPHPDVLRGYKPSDRYPPNPNDYDQLVLDTGIVACLEACDEVHTMTSLTGFEALLRGKRVVTYGRPFYAGWGLTEDYYPHFRNTRNLTLDELVFFSLTQYPIYINTENFEFTTAEQVIGRIEKRLRNQAPISVRRLPVSLVWLGIEIKVNQARRALSEKLYKLREAVGDIGIQ